MKTSLKQFSSLLMAGLFTVAGCGGFEPGDATGEETEQARAQDEPVETEVGTDTQGLFGLGWRIIFSDTDDNDDDPRWRDERYDRDRWRCTAYSRHRSYSETRRSLRMARRAARQECRQHERGRCHVRECERR